MRKRDLSKYFKLAAVLLYNISFVWYLVAVSRTDNSFMAIAFIISIIILIIFNLWALLIYKLTKRIQKPVQREVAFYVLLFLTIIWLLYTFFI